ncbi:hypothetical protein BSPLISOX_1055, partial [uncultured Gammaproteobacteria bacterium]
AIKNHITQVFEQIPIYGEKKVHQQLLEDGFKVSLNTVARYRQELDLKAVLAVKQVNTTIPTKERFWRSAKCERIYLNEYQSISELITDVDDYIEFYNYRRFHQTLKYKKPMDVYQESIKLNQEKAKAS